MQAYGYVRVSTREQNEARQLDALAPYEIPQKNLFVKKKSGKDFDRPVYKRMTRRLRPGDLLIVKSIDRLGRDYDEILEKWRHITKFHPLSMTTATISGNAAEFTEIMPYITMTAARKSRFIPHRFPVILPTQTQAHFTGIKWFAYPLV